MVDEGEEELRGAARNAPLGPLTLCQMRALDHGDEVRTPFTGWTAITKSFRMRWMPRSAVRWSQSGSTGELDQGARRRC